MARKVRVILDVPKDAPHNFSGRDVLAGETLYEVKVYTYDCVDTDGGIALTGKSDGGYPFFEFPRDAIEVIE
jgi:hypothetical protein